MNNCKIKCLPHLRYNIIITSTLFLYSIKNNNNPSGASLLKNKNMRLKNILDMFPSVSDGLLG